MDPNSLSHLHSRFHCSPCMRFSAPPNWLYLYWLTSHQWIQCPFWIKELSQRLDSISLDYCWQQVGQYTRPLVGLLLQSLLTKTGASQLPSDSLSPLHYGYLGSPGALLPRISTIIQLDLPLWCPMNISLYFHTSNSSSWTSSTRTLIDCERNPEGREHFQFYVVSCCDSWIGSCWCLLILYDHYAAPELFSQWSSSPVAK